MTQRRITDDLHALMGILPPDIAQAVVEANNSDALLEIVLDLGRLPGEAGDALRVIKIGDYDACPCIGRHISSTAEIGAFSIISTGFADGVLRIRFRLQQ